LFFIWLGLVTFSYVRFGIDPVVPVAIGVTKTTDVTAAKEAGTTSLTTQQAQTVQPRKPLPYYDRDHKEHFSHLMDEIGALLKDLASAASKIQRWDDTFRQVNSLEELEQASKDVQNAVDIGNRAMSLLYESMPREESAHYEELNLRDGKAAVSGFRSQAKAMKTAIVTAQHAIKSDDEVLRTTGAQMIVYPPRKGLIDSAQATLAWIPGCISNISAMRVALNDH
jgi:hypothetical protein